MRKKTIHLISKIVSVNVIEPLVSIIIYAGFLYFVTGVIPNSERLVVHLESLYSRYGYEILFLGAFLESLVVVNVFAPGMVALAFGGVFARTGQLNLTAAVLAAVAGAVTGYVIDYLLGYFGFSRIIERFTGINALGKIRRQVEKADVKLFSLGYFHPNLGSVIALAAGTVGMKFLNFLVLSILSTIVWFAFWSMLVYSMGDIVLHILNRYLTLIGLFFTSIWFLIFLYRRGISKNKKT